MKLASLLRMAWRNLGRHKRRTFLTALAFAVGVFLLVVSLALGDGMHEKMIETGIRLGSGHVLVERAGARDSLEELLYLSGDNAAAAEQVLARAEVRDHIRGVAPRLLASGLISSANNSTGVQIVGAVPEREVDLALLPEKITRGTFLEKRGRTPPALIGDALADKLGVDLGSKVVLMAQAGSEIQSMLLRVRGVFSTGMDDVDGHVISLRLEDLQKMIQSPGSVSHLAVFLDSSERTESARRTIEEQMAAAFSNDPPAVLSWQQAMPELAQFIVVDDAGNYLFNAVVLFMVTLGVLNTILMAVLERRREFSLLLALGMRPWEITMMVISESMLLTAVGTVAGLLASWAVYAYFDAYGLDFGALIDESFSVAGVGIDTIVYPHLYPGRVRWTLIFVTLLGLGASLYPALRAARTSPTEATQG